MSHLRIENLWVDDDEMLQLSVQASNGNLVGEQDFYVYPEAIAEFGRQLIDFPKSVTDKVSIEYGEDPKFYCYFRLTALVLDLRGHSALEIAFDNRLAPPNQASCHFYMPCEPATVNVLGKKLLSWLKNSEEPMVFEWNNA